MLPLFKLQNGFLLYDNKISVLGSAVKDIPQIAHGFDISGHFFLTNTVSRLDSFHWKQKTNNVEAHCDGCDICQCRKDSQSKPLGMCQSLEAPERNWGSVYIDFVTQLLVIISRFDGITKFDDRFSKRVHYVAGKATDTALDVASSFFDNIFRLHSLPYSIVSDKNLILTVNFWSALVKICGRQLKLSTR